MNQIEKGVGKKKKRKAHEEDAHDYTAGQRISSIVLECSVLGGKVQVMRLDWEEELKS